MSAKIPAWVKRDADWHHRHRRRTDSKRETNMAKTKQKKTVGGRQAAVVEIFPIGKAFGFRVETVKGKKYGHRFDRRHDAKRGVLAMISALRGRVVVRTLDAKGNQVSESIFLPGTIGTDILLKLCNP